MSVLIVLALILTTFDPCRCSDVDIFSPNPIVLGKPLIINISAVQIRSITNDTLFHDPKNYRELSIEKLKDSAHKKHTPLSVVFPLDVMGKEPTLSTGDRKGVTVRYLYGKKAAIIIKVEKATCSDIGIFRIKVGLSLDLERNNLTKYIQTDIVTYLPVISVEPRDGFYETYSYVTLKCDVNASSRGVNLEFHIRPIKEDNFLSLPLSRQYFEGLDNTDNGPETWPSTPVIKTYSENCSICPDFSFYHHQLSLTFEVEGIDMLVMGINCMARFPIWTENDTAATSLHVNSTKNSTTNDDFRLHQCEPKECEKLLVSAMAEKSESRSGEEKDSYSLGTLLIGIVVIPVAGVIVLAYFILLLRNE